MPSIDLPCASCRWPTTRTPRRPTPRGHILAHSTRCHSNHGPNVSGNDSPVYALSNDYGGWVPAWASFRPKSAGEAHVLSLVSSIPSCRTARTADTLQRTHALASPWDAAAFAVGLAAQGLGSEVAPLMRELAALCRSPPPDKVKACRDENSLLRRIGIACQGTVEKVSLTYGAPFQAARA